MPFEMPDANFLSMVDKTANYTYIYISAYIFTK